MPSGLIDEPVALAIDRSKTVTVVTCVLLGLTVLFFIARQIMKPMVFRTCAYDNIFISLASLTAIGSYVTTVYLASRGLGILAPLSAERLQTLMRGYYATQFLYLISISFSKLSVLVVLYTIVATQRLRQRLVLSLGFVVSSWGTAALIAVAFQCSMPRPWDLTESRCFNIRVFWIVNCCLDLATEVCIIMLAVHIVAEVRLRSTRKTAVVACFLPRILVMAAALARLVWLDPMTTYEEPGFHLWLPVIVTQVHICLGICTACVPYMVPFFRNLEATPQLSQRSTCRNTPIDQKKESLPSTLWFRRRKPKMLSSWDSTALSTLHYERVPQASPYIATPAPLSPLTPPRYHSPPSMLENSQVGPQTQRGLCISIPVRTRSRRDPENPSPQTASSFALSPSCTSPMASLSTGSFIPMRKAPTPPAKARSPSPPATNSRYSSRLSTQAKTPQPLFSLFPQQPSHSRRRSDEEHLASNSVKIAPIRGFRAQTVGPIGRPFVPTSPYKVLKSSTSPLLAIPQSNSGAPRANMRPGSVQDLTSPMGTAINDYFNTTAADLPVPEPEPAATQFSSQHHRNQQVLSPTNVSRTMPQSVHSSHSAMQSRHVLQHGLRLPRDSLLMSKSTPLDAMPKVRDVRNSPRFIVHGSQ